MYTECPECGIAFRVTAKVLQKANGNVRCGGCNHAFNSLEYLSEEMPGSIPADDSDVSDDALAETSRRLLKTLDELAGTREDRIEDTGVEWRVLAENLDGDYADDIEASDEMRYDDNPHCPTSLVRSRSSPKRPPSRNWMKTIEVPRTSITWLKRKQTLTTRMWQMTSRRWSPKCFRSKQNLPPSTPNY